MSQGGGKGSEVGETIKGVPVHCNPGKEVKRKRKAIKRYVEEGLVKKREKKRKDKKKGGD